MEYKDLTNQTFGGITALERDHELSKQKHRGWWKCRCNYCECGNLIVCRGSALRAGYNLSCGCKRRYRGETAIANLLTDKSISYKTQQTFEDFRFSKTNSMPRFDFGIYSEDKLVFLIEYNGIQHYQYVEYFQESIEDICARDQEKVRYCQIHNIPLEIIPYTEFDNLPEIIDKLLEKYQIKGGS